MSTADGLGAQPAHPLAIELAMLGITGRTLLLGVGNGRNLQPFIDCGINLDVVEADMGRLAKIQRGIASIWIRLVQSPYRSLPFATATYAAAISTHVLQHGSFDDVDATLKEIARVLLPGAPLLVVLGSANDRRNGAGTFVEANCWAPTSGDEIGIAHLYLDAAGVRALFEADFVIDELTEVAVENVVGRWAHEDAAGYVHWFVRANRRGGN